MSNHIKYSIPMEVGNLWFKMNWVAGFETRIVGGAVRDWAMGKEPKDLDFCTTATPAQMIAFAEEYDYRIEPTGLQHGTVSFIIDGVAYEFTTLRIDTDHDGRHATVQFTTDFEADAARRDFTMNAMSLDIDGKVHDYFGGWEDIQNGLVRFVGSAEDRIKEDYLRVLRFFRFAARFDAGMDWEALKFMCTEKVHRGLQVVSRERIWAEVAKIAVSPVDGRRAAMVQMRLTGVGQAIGMVPNQLAMACIERADDPATFMAGFCGGDPESFGRQWKMSVPEMKKMAHVFGRGPNWDTTWSYPWDTTAMVSDMLDEANPDWIRSCQRLWLPGMSDADFDRLLKAMPKFAVSGQDLMAEGFTQGKAMGDELKRRREAWKADKMKGL